MDTTRFTAEQIGDITITAQQLRVILCKAFEIFMYRWCNAERAKDILASWISGYLLISMTDACIVMNAVLNDCRRVTNERI